MRLLTDEECRSTKGGEAVTLTSVMALLVIGLVAVIAYKFFTSEEGKTVLPGGFTFSWG